MEDLARRIMRLFANALGLPEATFDPTINMPISALRALNYSQQLIPSKPGQLRAGAHSDYGSLTILMPQPGHDGLEILAPDGTWRPVPAIADAFVINIRDLMARRTDDCWLSTLHGVVNPSDLVIAHRRRRSFAFFHQPKWHQEITCLPSCLKPSEEPKYGQVQSGSYLMSKLQSTVQ
ncbi:MAG: isopenicillin N synthase-like dioxygenase [Paracoccaceae bacterium]|jgi:isopenicillin N synthase-like dioxygenase